MNRITAALLALVLLCAPTLGATLLPPGQQTFIDGTGKPLAGGSVQFYLPNTTTPKQTWKDAAQTILNTNPVKLDSAGRATIYGAGAYRQRVLDQYGNLVWDQLTADTSSAQISWGGTSTGTANAQTISATNFTSADGQIVAFIAGFTNSGQLTISANGSGAIPILKDTQSGPVNLTGQEVITGATVLLIYDAGRGAFHLVGGGQGAPGFGGSAVLTASNVTDLGLAASHNVRIAGNATIASFGSSASTIAPIYLLGFGGSTTLVHSANLVLPGAGPIYTTNGDSALAAYAGNGAWQVLAFNRYQGSSVDAGTIFAFAGPNCPNGSVFADGSPRSRTADAPLFAAIGGTWGAGDGSTTFNLPDARGEFLRGLDNGRGFDPGRAFASSQGDQIVDHSHSFATKQTLIGTGGTPGSVLAPDASGMQPFPTYGILNGNPGSETRPKNIAVLYCVKL